MTLFYQDGNMKIAYKTAGQGRNVLLLHGWGCSMEHFETVFNALKNDYRVTAIDFPAHGASSRPSQPWGVPEFAECTLRLMQALKLTPCHIIAHSFGGRVALYLAANHPECIDKMVLTGCAGLRPRQTEEQKKKSEAFQKKKKLLTGLTHVPLIGNLAEKQMQALRTKYGSADYNALDDEMKKTFVKVVSQDLRPLLPMIHASTLLVWGEKDDATPLWMGRVMEEEIADAGLVLFENDDHFAYLHQWQRFVTIVQSFFKN